MDKKEISRIEKKTRELMNTNLPPKGKRISIIYYYILEDANYHGLNRILTRNGNFGKFRQDGDIVTPLSYGSKHAESIFNAYQNKGGRTYDL